MSTLGAKNIKEMQEVEIVIAPSLLTEGKVYQKAQQLGMGKQFIQSKTYKTLVN